jgi:Tol biopolymer transport system component
MKRVQRQIVSLLCAAGIVAFAVPAFAGSSDPLPAAASVGAPTPEIGRAIVFSRGFDVMYWDSVNGLRTVDAGLDPAISSDGRFITYLGRVDGQCNPVKVYDVRARSQVSLPGLNTDACNGNPALSGDGRLVAYDSRGTVEGDPNGIFLYDIVNKQPIALPEPIQSGSNDESPTLSDDGTLMSFVSGRGGATFDDVFLADISNPAVPVLISLPGLNTNDSERDAYMSGDASKIAFVTGPSLGQRVHIYDRASATVLSPEQLIEHDTYDPALNRDGSIAAVAQQDVDLGDRHVALFHIATGTLEEPRSLASDLTDEGPGIADPVELIDDTPPVVKLRCKSPKDDVIRCKVTLSEAGRVTLKSKLDTVKAKKSLQFAEAGSKKIKLRFKREVEGKTTVKARAVDSAGLRDKAKKRVRVR